ncbi:MlrC domain protein [Methylobacterium sp. 4-46]|uniref:M81 family metallopeptidase n=1 Tax=unclassified Methylobacterium TaxID=2615210 RepID=UPI000152C763|nr:MULTISPECIES: M81 family metallopeptidase [Methylobacterium]ACA15317.1 MlrC domain protein [Methylobacterium sp. 4-46]WFT81043.1 M81 family metallopeptidase [Methylobacterium nodulans]
MRIVTARLNHETNTFSPLATPLAAFRPVWGEEARTAGTGSATALGAFLAFAESRGAEVAVPVMAHANPSGPVADAAFEALAAAILAAVAQGCDAILLDLHGAMVTESHDDGEGELLARIRAIAPDVPLGVALDLHANVTARMVENADVIIGFKTYPHVDMAETGDHVAHLVGRMLDEGLRPHQAWCHPPLLAHTLRMDTRVPGPMADLVAAARTMEARPGILAATLFGGFGLADLREAGASFVVAAESAAQAREAAAELGAALWARRAEFVYEEAPLADSIAKAQAAADGRGTGPVLLLDHGDNCMSGGTCDVMDVLAACLKAGLDGIVAGPICDPETVAELLAAGTGAAAEVRLGNKVPLPGFPPQAPLALTGRIAAVGDGSYVVTGPTYTGQRFSMGRAAVLDTGRARVLVTEEPHEPWDRAIFTENGIEPREARFLVLKSRMYCRPVFEPIARAVVECASAGVTSSDYRLFPFVKLARPTYPIDREVAWPAR